MYNTGAEGVTQGSTRVHTSGGLPGNTHKLLGVRLAGRQVPLLLGVMRAPGSGSSSRNRASSASHVPGEPAPASSPPDNVLSQRARRTRPLDSA